MVCLLHPQKQKCESLESEILGEWRKDEPQNVWVDGLKCLSWDALAGCDE